MKFCWITIQVKDLEESLSFYQDIVGLSLNRRFTGDGGLEIAFLGDGGTQVELLYNPALSDVPVGEQVSLGFRVDSVDEMIKFVTEKGVPVHSGPFQPNLQTRFFFVLDPNGVKVQFVELA